MASIAFENFRGQIQGAHYSTQPILLKGGAGMFSQSVIDPDRLHGALCPFPIKTALTNAASITTSITKMVTWKAVTPLVFGIGGALVYEIVPSSNTVTKTGNFPHTISGGGTGETASDLMIYENNGTTEVFYSWNDSANGNIGRLSAIPTTDTFDDDYFSAVAGGTVLNKNYPHPMAIGDNNICYVGNGSILASMDLRTGSPTATDTEIDILGGWIIKDHLSYNGFHWIAARESVIGEVGNTRVESRCGVYVWDYIKSSFDEIFYFSDSDIGKLFLHEGDLFLITSGTNTSKLRKYNGKTFAVVPNGLYKHNNLPTLGGVSEKNGKIIWSSSTSGEVYTHGDKLFNIIGDVGTVGGAIIHKPGSSNNYYITADNAVDLYAFTVDGGFTTSGSNFKSQKVDFPTHVHVKEFRVYFPDLSGSVNNDGGTRVFQLDAYFNGKEGNTTIGTMTASENTKGYKRIPYNKNDVYSINVGFQYSGANVPTDTAHILPYKIEVVFDQTAKR